MTPELAPNLITHLNMLAIAEEWQRRVDATCAAFDSESAGLPPFRESWEPVAAELAALRSRCAAHLNDAERAAIESAEKTLNNLEQLRRMAITQVRLCAEQFLETDMEMNAPAGVLRRVERAIERASQRRRFGSANALAEYYGQRAALYRLRKAIDGKSTFRNDSLADLVYRLGLSWADVVGGPPRPWHDWPSQAPIVVCVGARAARVPTQHDYFMLQREDARAGMLIREFFRQLDLTERVELFMPASRSEAESRLTDIQQTGGAFISVGSPHANPATDLVLAGIPPLLREADRYVFHLGDPDYRLETADANATWRRSETSDAGLIRILRAPAVNDPSTPCVLAVVAGLGPAGTLAAADALTCLHEVAIRFGLHLPETGGPNYMAQAVIVDQISVFEGAESFEHISPSWNTEACRAWVWDDER
jgi:hypothetical protein